MRTQGTPKTGGRVKGVPNKIPSLVTNMVYDALVELGGSEYFVKLAKSNPELFMSVVAKTMPRDIKLDVTGEVNSTVEHVSRIKLVAVQPNILPNPHQPPHSNQLIELAKEEYQAELARHENGQL
jgi:hypothetical protein